MTEKTKEVFHAKIQERQAAEDALVAETVAEATDYTDTFHGDRATKLRDVTMKQNREASTTSRRSSSRTPSPTRPGPASCFSGYGAGLVGRRGPVAPPSRAHQEEGRGDAGALRLETDG